MGLQASRSQGGRRRKRSVARRAPRSGGLLVRLTSFITLISADRRLVLCERSTRVRSGAGVLSVSAGGILSPGDDSTDWTSTRAERPTRWRRFAANFERSWASRSHGPACSDQWRFPGRARSGFTEPRQRRSWFRPCSRLLAAICDSVRSSSGRSAARISLLARSEVAVLHPVRMSDVNASAHFADHEAHQLDQHGFLSILYAAMVAWGADATLAAFGQRFEREPLVRKASQQPPSTMG